MYEDSFWTGDTGGDDNNDNDHEIAKQIMKMALHQD